MGGAIGREGLCRASPTFPCLCSKKIDGDKGTLSRQGVNYCTSFLQ